MSALADLNDRELWVGWQEEYRDDGKPTVGEADCFPATRRQDEQQTAARAGAGGVGVPKLAAGLLVVK
jgi:hypothetical protein